MKAIAFEVSGVVPGGMMKKLEREGRPGSVARTALDSSVLTRKTTLGAVPKGGRWLQVGGGGGNRTHVRRTRLGDFYVRSLRLEVSPTVLWTKTTGTVSQPRFESGLGTGHHESFDPLLRRPRQTR